MIFTSRQIQSYAIHLIEPTIKVFNNNELTKSAIKNHIIRLSKQLFSEAIQNSKNNKELHVQSEEVYFVKLCSKKYNESKNKDANLAAAYYCYIKAASSIISSNFPNLYEAVREAEYVC